MILFSAEAIFASSTSKFGIGIPLVDDEDFKSSTESTISTSLIQKHSFRRKLWTSTYVSLESYLPASKGGWCWEFVEMKIRNLQSLLVCPHKSLNSLLHRRWLNFWLTVQAGISDLALVFAFHSFPLWRNEAALRSMNSIDSILADKVLIMTHLDLQKKKKVPDIPCVSQMLGGPSLRLGTP